MPDINLTADEIDAAEEVFGPLTVAQMHWLEEFAQAHRDEAVLAESMRGGADVAWVEGWESLPEVCS
jgi:hypothetical protein